MQWPLVRNEWYLLVHNAKHCKRFLTILSAYVPTSEASLTVEEEDAIVTLVVVVIGIIVAIVVLFSMGIFIDCKHQYVTISLFQNILILLIEQFS